MELTSLKSLAVPTRILEELRSHQIFFNQAIQMNIVVTDSRILKEYRSEKQPTSLILMTVATNNFHVLGCHA